MKRHINRFMKLRLLIIVCLMCFSAITILPLKDIYASDVKLNWEQDGSSVQGEYIFSIVGETPTEIASFEIIIGYDPDAMTLLSASSPLSDMNAEISDRGDGIIIITGNGSLASGGHDFGTLTFKSLGENSTRLSISRTSFFTPNDEKVPSTMQLILELDTVTPQDSSETTVKNQETTTTTSKPNSASSTETLSKSQGQDKNPATKATVKSTASTNLSKVESTGSNHLALKIILAVVSLILAVIIALSLSSSKRRR